MAVSGVAISTGEKTDRELIDAVKNADLNLPVVDSNILPSHVSKPADGDTTSGVHYTYST